VNHSALIFTHQKLEISEILQCYKSITGLLLAYNPQLQFDVYLRSVFRPRRNKNADSMYLLAALDLIHFGWVHYSYYYEAKRLFRELFFQASSLQEDLSGQRTSTLIRHSLDPPSMTSQRSVLCYCRILSLLQI